MENAFFHRLSRALWGGIVILMVLLAIYVSVGRMLAANLGVYQAAILQELNSRLPFTVAAQRVSGEWQSFTPIIVLTGLRLSVAGSSEAPLELSEGRIGVDVLNSLRTRSLQMTRVALDDLSLKAELTSEGKLHLIGFDSGGGQVEEWLREFLLHVELVALRNNRLRLTMPSGERRDLDFDLLLSRDGSQRRVTANLASNRGTEISLLAEGVGNPFKPELFSGDLYLDIQSTDMGAVKDLLANGPPGIWADGAIDLELWLAWSKGVSSVEARVEARDLVFSGPDQDWQVPLDRVALQARLVERRNHWTLFTSDVQLEKDDIALRLPRLQMDAWGNALRVRAIDVPLAPINAIVTSMDAVPEALLNVLSALQPRGKISFGQLHIGNISEPASDWGVEANFEEVAVDSWKGAPGVTSASGYVQFARSGGFVVLDSQQFAMDFPTIFREPLRFDDFHGTINMDWGAEAFSLSSGLVTALGEEGTEHVLFGLNIPLVASDVGIELDLLVGLEQSHPIHRVKYVPYVLNPSLLAWLSDSIGDGRIEQGAFLWRGSVKPKIAPLRTIQLAFNVTDTYLEYHPQWPPVTVHDGIIFIDDSEVSVWADRASLFDSSVERLSVETWLNEAGHIMLAVDGRVQGPAADGLAVLNESALARIVGGAFANWKLTGDLDTDLELQMNLTDQSVPPRVDVATRWRDVSLDIVPGNLPVRELNGEFNYSTAQGFSSKDLVGELWGKALNVNLVQRHRGRGYDAGSSVVEVGVAAKVDMADVRRWLNLEPLAFVSGQTTADVKVLVAPGEPPLLNVDSSLLGVSLDLPRPWKKTGKEAMRLHLEMPLAAGGQPLSLALGEELKLVLDVADGVLRAGALAIDAEPATLEAGVLHIGGHAALMQGDDWIRFVTEYFAAGELAPEAGQVTGGSPPVATAPGASPAIGPGSAAGGQLKIIIDQLQADTLVIRDQSLQDVMFSLVMEPAMWRLSVATDWLRGAAYLARDGGPSRLDIKHLDIAGLARLNLSPDGPQESLDLPAMDVTLDDIYQSGRHLGHLAFGLRSQGGILTADNITGELASLSLSAERPGQLIWRQGQEGETELQASLNFEDLGRTLQYFDYQKILQTKNGSFDMDLRWPGPPQDFSLQQGRGSVQVKIGSGSFLEAPSGASGALRVVSILNLADIVRRLSLSHMFESGIPFEGVTGEVYLHEGTIEVARMEVRGSSSFQFSGVSDVATQSLDGELVATLPVARNLPWIAVLAASLPVAAGVFVISKVFNKQMNRLSSAVYTISGSWNDPQVQFDHIFDDTSQRTSGSAAKRATDAGSTESGATASDAGSPGTPALKAPVQSVAP